MKAMSKKLKPALSSLEPCRDLAALSGGCDPKSNSLRAEDRIQRSRLPCDGETGGSDRKTHKSLNIETGL